MFVALGFCYAAGVVIRLPYLVQHLVEMHRSYNYNVDAFRTSIAPLLHVSNHDYDMGFLDACRVTNRWWTLKHITGQELTGVENAQVDRALQSVSLILTLDLFCQRFVYAAQQCRSHHRHSRKS